MKGVECAHAVRPLRVDQDESAVAAPFLAENADGELCGLLGILDGPEDLERAAREDHADGRLAVPRARHAAQLALRVGAAADQRRVADAPRELARPAPGGRARDDGAEAVDGDGADGARLERLEPLSLPLGDELAGSQSGTPRARAWSIAPAPTKKEWRPSSRMRRARVIGFRTSETQATAPLPSVSPSMMDASISTVPAVVRTEPRPALKRG
jgi:hypothetical protein